MERLPGQAAGSQDCYAGGRCCNVSARFRSAPLPRRGCRRSRRYIGRPISVVSRKSAFHPSFADSGQSATGPNVAIVLLEFSALLRVGYQNQKKREVSYVTSILTIIISVALYVLCLLQVELKNEFIKIDIYKYGSYLTLIVSMFLLLISKYDEVEASSTYRADKGKNATTIEINGEKVKL